MLHLYISLILSIPVLGQESNSDSPYTNWNYPSVRRDESVVDKIFNVHVEDPYRWLENLTSPETLQFIGDQNAITDKYLNGYGDRSLIQKTLEKMYNVTKIDPKTKAGNYSYWTARSGLQGNKILYRQLNNGTDEVFVDPNDKSPEETGFIDGFASSPDDKYIVYSISRKGSDWKAIFLRNNDEKAETVHTIKWTKDSSVTWNPNGRGFFYGTYPEPEDVDWEDAGLDTDPALDYKIWYHAVDEKRDDELVLEAGKDSSVSYYLDYLGENGEWLIYTSEVEFYYADATKLNQTNNANDIEWKKVYKFENEIYDIAPIDSSSLKLPNKTFLFKTTEGAPYGRVIQFDLDKYDQRSNYLPEQQGYGLVDVKIYNKTAIASYAKDGVYHLMVYQANKPEKPLYTFKLPVGELKKFELDDSENILSYNVTDLLYPSKQYKIELNSTYPAPKLADTLPSLPGFPADRYEVEQLHYTSKDGTEIPMTFAHPKGIEKNGKNPILLFGYGGFSIFNSGTPKEHFQTLLQLYNVSIAIPHIRGGSENGEPWHTDGVVLKKQNSYDDFQWAAKYLVKEKYTSANRIIANGRSNGGTLTAVTFNQAPDLFGGFVADVGVMDLVRYQRFTYGSTWFRDFGNVQVEDEFKNNLKFSPYYNARANENMPPLMITTGTHDDRVSPLHSYKLASKIQYLNNNRPNPALLTVTHNAGHGCSGCGKPVKMEIRDRNKFITFIALTLNLKPN